VCSLFVPLGPSLRWAWGLTGLPPDTCDYIYLYIYIYYDTCCALLPVLNNSLPTTDVLAKRFVQFLQKCSVSDSPLVKCFVIKLLVSLLSVLTTKDLSICIQYTWCHSYVCID